MDRYSWVSDSSSSSTARWSSQLYYQVVRITQGGLELIETNGYRESKSTKLEWAKLLKVCDVIHE